MTISITAKASGTPDHVLEVIQNGHVRQTDVSNEGAPFSVSVWKGAPVVLREPGDTDVAVVYHSQVKAAFMLWGMERAEGKCLPHAEADALPLAERAQLDADALFKYLGLA